MVPEILLALFWFLLMATIYAVWGGRLESCSRRPKALRITYMTASLLPLASLTIHHPNPENLGLLAFCALIAALYYLADRQPSQPGAT